MGWWILGAIVTLIVAYVVALQFSEIAEMKGHDGKAYFWFTFLLGICGMLMVVALPDIKSTESIEKTIKNNSLHLEQSAPKVEPEPKPAPKPEPKRQSELQPQTRAGEAINRDNPPVSAEIQNGEKVCPMCGHAQRVNRTVCFSCGQSFDN